MSEAASSGAGRIAAVIVTYRTGEALFDCLAAAIGAPDIDEIVVVDNGNPDDALTRMRAVIEASAKASLITGHGNVGFARGCNLGAAATTAAHLLFLNPDASIGPGAAAVLRDTGDGRARPWIVGGRVLSLQGEEQRGGRRDELAMWSSFATLTGLTRLARLHRAFAGVNRHQEAPPKEPIAVGAVSGAFMAMRADDFAALGGFDEGYFVHVEDVDLCRRAREAGGEVVFTPHASVAHVGATSEAGSLTVAWHKGKSLARYFRKFARSPWDRALAVAMTPAVVAAALAQGVFRAVFSGWRRP